MAENGVPRDWNERMARIMAVDRSALPPDGGEDFNRLIFASSPYLLQHAENPVDWYQWGDEAFARARAEDKPLFLSIGYATCHWCHVMEEESFENAEVAAVLNRHYVAIKVDREERPDIDEQFMAVAQILTGSGGWPLNIILTPDRRPFFAATYLPVEPRMGMPGIVQLLERIAEIWESERDKVEASGAGIMDSLRRVVRPDPGELPGEEIFRQAKEQLASMYDPEWGGFGTSPKFPVPHNLMFLLRYWKRSGDGASLAMVERTLRLIRAGGIFDQIGFGVHRYSTDRQWLVPHFEKMLYDQALFAIACLETFQAMGDPAFLRCAEETLDFTLREMTSPEGGFHSGQDADTEGEEGRYYVWSPGEIREILGEGAAGVFCRLFGVTDRGNFDGGNILHLPLEAEEFARMEGISPDILLSDLERWRTVLLAAREKRTRPFRDGKIVTAWNGLMIAALAKGYAVTGSERYLAAAERGAAFILERLRNREGRLLRSFHRGEGSVPAFLEDYAFLVHGLIGLHEATLGHARLSEARLLTDDMLRLFGDTGGGLYDAGADAEEVLIRKKGADDVVMPSGNSMAAMNLFRLGRISKDDALIGEGERIMQAFMGSVKRQPAGYPYFLCALDYCVGPAVEVTFTGRRDNPETGAMLRVVGRRFIPNLVVRFDEKEKGTGRGDGGRCAARLCLKGACLPSVTGASALEEILGANL